MLARKYLRMLRELGRLRKRAGKVRDMDVLTGFALTARTEGEQDCLVQLIERLGAARAKHARRLRDLVAARGRRLQRWLKRAESKLLRDLEESKQKRGVHHHRRLRAHRAAQFGVFTQNAYGAPPSDL